MLIARLIADKADLLTRIAAVKAELEPEAMPIEASATPLGDNVLVEITTLDGNLPLFRQVIDTHFAPADMLIAKDEVRVPALFISDMDSTMIGQECIDELADFAGLKDRIAEITERAMQGELDFNAALIERVGLLAGLDEGAIQQCLDERIRPNPGARVLVETLKAQGCRTVLVTGGFHHFADPVADQIGFEHVVGNRLDVADGRLTGGLVGEICNSATKKAVHDAELGALPAGSASMAAGDGANDIPMLQAATYGIAYYAKPKARAAANGVVEAGDLTALLSLLGIPQSEWVTG